MILSRLAPSLLILIAPAGAASARPPSAEDAMSNYRKVFQPIRELDCPRGEDNEIVVCARSRDGPAPGRLPLPVEREPGERVKLVPGEASRADVGHGDGRYCFERCGDIVGLDRGTVEKIVKGIKKIIEGDD